MMSTLLGSPVQAVLRELRRAGVAHDRDARRRFAEELRVSGRTLGVMERAELHRDAPLAISDELGRVLYVLARGLRARVIVEFGTSLGVSAIHLAAGIRDGAGQGTVIGTEIHPQKASHARANLQRAGLADLFELRVGDALQTLAELPGRADLLFLDGWNELYLPVLQQLSPMLARGAVVVADLSRDDPALTPYLDLVRDRSRGWLSVTLALDAGVEVSVQARAAGRGIL